MGEEGEGGLGTVESSRRGIQFTSMQTSQSVSWSMSWFLSVLKRKTKGGARTGTRGKSFKEWKNVAWFQPGSRGMDKVTSQGCILPPR